MSDHLKKNALPEERPVTEPEDTNTNNKDTPPVLNGSIDDDVDHSQDEHDLDEGEAKDAGHDGDERAVDESGEKRQSPHDSPSSPKDERHLQSE